MVYIFWSIIAFYFIYLNQMILASDFKYKIIPNKLLRNLIALAIIYNIILIINWNNFNPVNLLHFSTAIIISFLLFSIWVWSAWDAKYLLVLSLFIVNIWLIPFLWNIAIITIIYLLYSFIHFYLRLLIKPKLSHSLIKNLINDNSKKFSAYLYKWSNWKTEYTKTLLKITKELIWFILFFVIIRILRWDIIEQIKWLMSYSELISTYWSYFIILTWVLWFIIVYLYRKISNNTKDAFIKKFNKVTWKEIKEIYVYILWTLVSVTILISLVIYDYTKIWNEIYGKIYKILTFYLLLSLWIRLLVYAYKITFITWEQKIINFLDLKEWDLVDRTFLINNFWNQNSIMDEDSKKILENKNPIEYFLQMQNPIDADTKIKLTYIYNKTKEYHDNHKRIWNAPKTIKILNSFAFWWYIFTWFIITFLFWDLPMRMLIKLVVLFIIKLTHL